MQTCPQLILHTFRISNTGTKIVLHFLLQLASKIQWSQNLFKKIHLPMQILKDKLDIMQVTYRQNFHISSVDEHILF